MKQIINLYETALAQYGDSPNSVLWPKGRQAERFTALTKHILKAGQFSLLDFGCGLAHLKPYLNAYFEDVTYSGVDLVSAFISINSDKYPQETFYSIESVNDIKDSYDYIVSSGAFNILYSQDSLKHQEIVFEILAALFEKTKIALSVNFMSDQVDFVAPSAYHQNILSLYQYLTSKLSKRILIDQSYMPYEFTVVIWKNNTIIRPENIYERE